MGIKSVVKKGFSGGFRVTRWVGLSGIKDNAGIIIQLARKLFKASGTTASAESFDQLMQRLNWSEKDLQQRLKQGRYLVWFCLAAGLLLLTYTFYLIHCSQYLPSFVCLMLSCLLFAHAFREHITLFRLRRRCLESTVQEWFRNTFMGSK